MFISTSKDRPKTKGSITLRIRIADLLTSVLFTVFKNVVIDVVLSISFIDKHVPATLPDEQKVFFEN